MDNDYRFATLVLAWSLLLSPVAEAQTWSINDEERWHSVLGGVMTGIAIHELGHFGMAEALGRKADYDGVTIFYPEPDLSDRDRARLASAGIQTQWLLSEYLLREAEHNQKPLSSFRAGLVLSNLLISAAYMTVLNDHEDGDVIGIHESTGWSRSTIALALAIPAVFDTWRLIGTDKPNWIPKVSLFSKGIGFTALWTF